MLLQPLEGYLIKQYDYYPYNKWLCSFGLLFIIYSYDKHLILCASCIGGPTGTNDF